MTQNPIVHTREAFHALRLKAERKIGSVGVIERCSHVLAEPQKDVFQRISLQICIVLNPRTEYSHVRCMQVL